MSFPQNFVRSLGYTFLCAGLLTLATFCWNQHGWLSKADLQWTRWMSILESDFRDVETRYVNQWADEFVFINVSNALQLTPLPESNGGKAVITDREMLGNFIGMLARHPDYHKVVVLGVLLDEPAEGDSLLAHHLNKVPNLLAASTLLETSLGPDSLIKPIFRVEHAVAQIKTSRNVSFRMKKQYSAGYASLSYALYKKLHVDQISSTSWWPWRLNSFYVPPTLRPTANKRLLQNYFHTLPPHIEPASYFATLESIVNRHEAIQEEDIVKQFKDKIIIIGAFTGRDDHQSVLGYIPGPLLIANGYLALQEGRDIIDISLILILLFGFTLVLYPIFVDPNVSLDHSERWKQIQSNGWAKITISFFQRVVLKSSISQTLLILLLLQIVVFWGYQIHITVLVWTVLISLAGEYRELVVAWWQRKRSRQEHTANVATWRKKILLRRNR